MGETRRKFDRDFRAGAVRLVRETGKPVAQVARDLGMNAGTLGNWAGADRRRPEGGDGQLSEGERGELPPRAARRQRLKAEVARLFAVREGKDGAPRIAAALREAGWTVSENTVAGLMREQGLAARPGRKGRRHTTRQGKGRQHARAHRTWSGGTSRPPGSTASGTGTAPRSPPGKASCTS